MQPTAGEPSSRSTAAQTQIGESAASQKNEDMDEDDLAEIVRSVIVEAHENERYKRGVRSEWESRVGWGRREAANGKYQHQQRQSDTGVSPWQVHSNTKDGARGGAKGQAKGHFELQYP